MEGIGEVFKGIRGAVEGIGCCERHWGVVEGIGVLCRALWLWKALGCCGGHWGVVEGFGVVEGIGVLCMAVGCCGGH